ncbi:lysophospholipid acyltransferase family protein [Alloacidobacterium dinghuense]|uniref:Lysophospholipid acyltransferase family protein n=1 Tax=Alloacidobacterium dinghuense TaxID=2763107 RepID=A0A7G8BN79_9BACT|nr:lysophospholipid acyltransferase family protein [Alloacidobacterium dinghuense]QNI33999.1 lysophospholipid acyltransferase family protein [Alloacidobacterium dinghuense]
MQESLEFAVVWGLVRLLRLLPGNVARAVGVGIGLLAFRIVPRLRSVGLRNLELAFPDWNHKQRYDVLRNLYRHLGWLLAEFCQMPRYTRENSRSFLRYDGLDRYLAARDKGKGVLIVTGHLGAWELSSFYHSLMGYPMSMVIRRLDNARVDGLVNHIRCLHGNRVLHKDDFARGLLGAMRQGETVGILMDTNMTPPQGVFVPFFGKPACTASGLARVALKTGAAVLPGFMLWEKAEQKYVLHFGDEIVFDRTGDDEADTVTNTAKCTAAIEAYVRQYPDQWLWVHRRWKTRPEGEPPIY